MATGSDGCGGGAGCGECWLRGVLATGSGGYREWWLQGVVATRSGGYKVLQGVLATRSVGYKECWLQGVLATRSVGLYACDRLVPSVVKMTAESGRPRFDCRYRRCSFPRSSLTGDLQNWLSSGYLPGTWRYGVSAGTGWPGVGLL